MTAPMTIQRFVELARHAAAAAGLGANELAETALFGEGPGGIIVAGTREALMELSSRARGVGSIALGTTGGDTLEISGFSAEASSTGAATAPAPVVTLEEISLDVHNIQRIHSGALAERASSS